MDNVKIRQDNNILQSGFENYFGVIARKQTYQNLTYLLARSICFLIDLLVLLIFGALVLGLIAIPLWIFTWPAFDLDSIGKLTAFVTGGVIAIPLLVLLGYPNAVLEQKMAYQILKVHLGVTPFWSTASSFPKKLGNYVFSALAWKRVLFTLLRIPLGLISSVLILVMLPLAILLFAMPAVHLAGFHDLILWELRVDSFWESMVIALLVLPLIPLVLHLSNLLSRFSARLAKELVSDRGFDR